MDSLSKALFSIQLIMLLTTEVKSFLNCVMPLFFHIMKSNLEVIYYFHNIIIQNRNCLNLCGKFIKSDQLKKRQLLRLAILQPFLAIFCQLHKYISQTLGADGHCEGLNVSKSQLDQNLWHKSQTIVFFNIGRKKPWKFKFQKWPFFDHLWSCFWQLHRYLSQNWDSDGHFEVLSVSKS